MHAAEDHNEEQSVAMASTAVKAKTRVSYKRKSAPPPRSGRTGTARTRGKSVHLEALPLTPTPRAAKRRKVVAKLIKAAQTDAAPSEAGLCPGDAAPSVPKETQPTQQPHEVAAAPIAATPSEAGPSPCDAAPAAPEGKHPHLQDACMQPSAASDDQTLADPITHSQEQPKLPLSSKAGRRSGISKQKKTAQTAPPATKKRGPGRPKKQQPPQAASELACSSEPRPRRSTRAAGEQQEVRPTEADTASRQTLERDGGSSAAELLLSADTTGKATAGRSSGRTGRGRRSAPSALLSETTELATSVPVQCQNAPPLVGGSKDASAPVPKKRRGRVPGSKNKFPRKVTVPRIPAATKQTRSGPRVKPGIRFKQRGAKRAQQDSGTKLRNPTDSEYVPEADSNCESLTAATASLTPPSNDATPTTAKRSLRNKQKRSVLSSGGLEPAVQPKQLVTPALPPKPVLRHRLLVGSAQPTALPLSRVDEQPRPHTLPTGAAVLPQSAAGLSVGGTAADSRDSCFWVARLAEKHHPLISNQVRPHISACIG